MNPVTEYVIDAARLERLLTLNYDARSMLRAMRTNPAPSEAAIMQFLRMLLEQFNAVADPALAALPPDHGSALSGAYHEATQVVIAVLKEAQYLLRTNPWYNIFSTKRNPERK